VPGPNVPHTFDARYNKGKVLGEGAFSQAIECTGKFDSLKYACKITKKELLQSEEDIVAITGEIEILKKLNHPSIVGCIDNFEDAEHFYVILDLMQGGELFDRIVQKAHYNEAEARNLFITITRGIKFLHDNNIVHRDLKPENLLMENSVDDTKVKIADFGFAKIANGLRLSTMCGSPGYVAPEILKKMKYGTISRYR
jgi:calcium/calmodulin-dependent protein kinase I